MKITNVSISVHTFVPPQTVGFPKEGKLGVLTIDTDEGMSGHTHLFDQRAISPGVEALAGQIVELVKPRLLGRNPLDIGVIWNELRGMSLPLHRSIQGYVDVALWDIAGKAAGLPVHRLLGTCREEMPVYASSWALPAPEDYIDEARVYQAMGIRAYKLHPPSFSAFFTRSPWSIDADIAACRKVREAVGDGLTLMFDGFFRYSYPEALKMGLALQELGYYWYEDPLKSDDIYGYQRLKEKLSIPLMATEQTEGGVFALPVWLMLKATDFLRGDVAVKGGITGMMKMAHLAEAFGLNCEVHDAYTPMMQFASLNVAMAIQNHEYFEVLVPNAPGKYGFEFYSYGLEEPFKVDERGYVHAPTLPGIGCRIDWPLMESTKVGVIS
jgi:L-alanine-DL-glutamate epimerase-like enolase superfamily enzyme